MNKQEYDQKTLLAEAIARFRTANVNRISYDGLTKAEYTFLMVVNNIKKPVTSVELKRFFDCSKAYVSKVVSILMEKDLLAMEKSEEDGRAKNLILTEKGSIFVNKYIDAYLDCMDYLCDRFGEEKVTEFANLLNEAMAILKEHDEAITEGRQ